MKSTGAVAIEQSSVRFGVFEEPNLTLVYPWLDGTVLNHATIAGSDRRALERFRRLPIDRIERAVAVVLDAHAEIAACGLVAVDFYDGCLLYDFDNDGIWLIDLDEYRPAPFVLDADGLPGSTSYMAPEEFTCEAVIDERTTVFNLGRMLHHLFASDDGWRGTIHQSAVVEVATDTDPSQRHTTVAALSEDWARATEHSQPTRMNTRPRRTRTSTRSATAPRRRYWCSVSPRRVGRS